MDDDIWQKLIENVKPLNNKRFDYLVKKEKPEIIVEKQKFKSKDASESPSRAKTRNHQQDLPLKIDNFVDVDRITAKKFKTGKLPIEARLDLHGLNREEAQNSVASFINNNYSLGKRMLLIITGKGRGEGILKQELPKWLNIKNTRQSILLIARAQPKDGGEGALYILLKRQRKNF